MPMLLRLLLLPLLAALAVSARAPAAEAQPFADVTLIAEHEAVLEGEEVWAALHFEMQPGWHIYWRNAGDAGLPPRIDWDEGAGPAEGASVTEGADFTWPVPELLEVVPGEIMDYGYSGTVALPFRVVVPEGASEVRLEGLADYLICETTCVPETARIALTLPVAASPMPEPWASARIAESLAAAPEPLAGEARVTADVEALTLSVTGAAQLQPEAVQAARFFPHDHQIRHAAPQQGSRGADGVRLRLETDSYSEPLGDGLSGVLTLYRSDGSVDGVRIDAPPGPVLDGTSGEALALARSAKDTGGSDAAGAAGGSSDNGGDGGLGTGAGALPLGAVLGFALLGGLVLNLMPCVLPVLTLKAVGMAEAAADGRGSVLRAHGLAYTAGVVGSFLAIAGVFLILREAGEFVNLGFQLQYPGAVAALALVMFAIGLWMTGMIELGGSVQGVGDGLARQGGTAGAFFTGVLAAVVGAPCVGPFMAGALGAVSTSPAPMVVLIFALLGLGLALPFLLLSFVPGLHRFLPKPGIWMDRLKQVFAVPLFITAAWLASVLAQQAGAGAVFWLLTAAALVWLGVWLLGLGAAGRAVPVAAAALLLGGPALAMVQAERGAPPAPARLASLDAGAIPAPQPWSEAAVAAELEAGRGVFVDFTASWCVTCQVNKRTTLGRADVRAAMAAAGVTFMEADFTRKDPAIADVLRRYNSPGVPLYLLYAPGDEQPSVLNTLLSPDYVKRQLEAMPAS